MSAALFFENCLTAGSQVLILFIIVAAGAVCDKLGVFTEKTARASNDLLFYLITPCVIINSFLTTEFSPDTAKAFALAGLCAAVTHAVGIALSLPFFRKEPPDRAAVFRFASVYGNMGYMALPLAQAVLGSEGVFYCSAGIIVFQIFCFTHGVYIMKKGEGGEKFKPKTLLFNPGVIAVIIGLPFFLLKIQLPQVITAPVAFIGSMNTPLAMLMFGTYIANAGLKTILKNRQQYLVALIKIIAVPLAVLALLKISGLAGGVLLTACIIQASAPSANNTVMFAAKYGKDTGTASKTVSFVSFASILTMPVMIALTQI